MTVLDIALGVATAIVTLATSGKIIVNMITKDIGFKLDTFQIETKRDIKEIADDMKDVKHNLKNQTMRIDALEHLDTQRVERIVRLEANQLAFERGQARIETGLKDMKDESARGRAEIIDTIREISKRDMRP